MLNLQRTGRRSKSTQYLPQADQAMATEAAPQAERHQKQGHQLAECLQGRCAPCTARDSSTAARAGKVILRATRGFIPSRSGALWDPLRTADKALGGTSVRDQRSRERRI